MVIDELEDELAQALIQPQDQIYRYEMHKRKGPKILAVAVVERFELHVRADLQPSLAYYS